MLLSLFGDALLFSLVVLYGTPILSLCAFVVCLVLYRYALRQNKKQPDTYSPAQIKHRKIALIVSSVVLGIFVLLFVALTVLLLTEVAFM